jgi:hypothetical protein
MARRYLPTSWCGTDLPGACLAPASLLPPKLDNRAMSFKRSSGSTAPTQKPDLTRYAEAIAAENAAWVAVKDRLPGSADFDQALWLRWQEAVAASDLIRTTGREHDIVDLEPVRPTGGNVEAGSQLDG